MHLNVACDSIPQGSVCILHTSPTNLAFIDTHRFHVQKEITSLSSHEKCNIGSVLLRPAQQKRWRVVIRAVLLQDEHSLKLVLFAFAQARFHVTSRRWWNAGKNSAARARQHARTKETVAETITENYTATNQRHLFYKFWRKSYTLLMQRISFHIVDPHTFRECESAWYLEKDITLDCINLGKMLILMYRILLLQVLHDINWLAKTVNAQQRNFHQDQQGTYPECMGSNPKT